MSADEISRVEQAAFVLKTFGYVRVAPETGAEILFVSNFGS